MKVVMVKPGQYAHITEIGSGLDSLQKAVGGLIDCAYPWKDKACIVCNDEGLINGMPMNRTVEGYGELAGPFFVCGIRGENFCSLTDEQAETYRALFLKPQLFVRYRDGILPIPYDNPDLPNAPETVRAEYAARGGLPEHCFCALPGSGEVILVRHGEHNYLPLGCLPEEDAAGYADALNKAMGVSKQQQVAMLWGSMFGWDIPAADPARYDENGQPKRKIQKHTDKER